MKVFSSCTQAVDACLQSRAFSIAHLYKEEKTMDMHIHDCYELYYSISGGKQFLIDNKFYSIEPGDLFLINQYESHKLIQVESGIHERIVIHLYPDYVRSLSTRDTDLDACFSDHPADFIHRIRLSRESQNRFLYYVDKITSADGFAHDIVEKSSMMELLVLLNTLSNSNPPDSRDRKYDHQVADILIYINQNITRAVTVAELAEHFFLSPSYLCRIFKTATGTTISKYICARRITIAKALLAGGCSVTEAWQRSGFSDYSSFFKAFTKAVGLSPKKYVNLSVSHVV